MGRQGQWFVPTIVRQINSHSLLSSNCVLLSGFCFVLIGEHWYRQIRLETSGLVGVRIAVLASPFCLSHDLPPFFKGPERQADEVPLGKGLGGLKSLSS